MKNHNSYNLGQKVVDKLMKLSKIGFSMVFIGFFGVDGLILAVKSKHFEDFIEIS